MRYVGSLRLFIWWKRRMESINRTLMLLFGDNNQANLCKYSSFCFYLAAPSPGASPLTGTDTTTATNTSATAAASTATGVPTPRRKICGFTSRHPFQCIFRKSALTLSRVFGQGGGRCWRCFEGCQLLSLGIAKMMENKLQQNKL